MFEEEELELEHNPDDDSYSRLGGSNVDEGHATTPKHPKTSRKRTRSQESEASVPMNLDATHITRRKNRKILERLEVVKVLRSAPIFEQLKVVLKDSRIFEELSTEKETLAILLQFHQRTFVFLYEESANGKDKFISFQIQWYKYCSILLLPKEQLIQCIFSPPTYEMVTVREMWIVFCEKFVDRDSEELKKFMIKSFIRNIQHFLREVHACVAQISMTASTSKSTTIVVSTEQVNEGDDVYFRFAGATLASMLHNRYKEIRKCIKEKIVIISEEIANN